MTNLPDRDALRLMIRDALPSLADATDEQMLIESLMELPDVSELQAELIAGFVPLAFGRVLIARMDVAPPLELADIALLFDEQEQVWQVPLAAIAEYTIAIELGETLLTTGQLAREQLHGIVAGSAEIQVIAQAIREGDDIAGATLAPPALMRLDVAGFPAWRRAVGATLWEGDGT